MSQEVRLFLVCHAYAFIWSFTHIMIAIGLFLLYNQAWISLLIYVAFLSMSNQVRFPRIPTIVKYFIPGLTKLVGGCEIIRNDLRRSDGRRVKQIRPRIYAVHPHAIAANGFGLAMYDCARRGESVTVAASSWLCIFNPLFRWFVNSLGIGFTSVRRQDISQCMSASQNIGILPGGFEEVLLMHKNSDFVFIKHRFGFLKLAVEYHYDIVPVFLFGESKLYDNLLYLPWWVRRVLAKLRLPAVIPTGKSCFNFLPRPNPQGLRIVFGEPIHTADTPNISNLHALYISRLQHIHEEHNLHPDTSLVIE
jgi:hypothetical protein